MKNLHYEGFFWGGAGPTELVGSSYKAFQLGLKNDKIAKLGVWMITFEEGLKEIKSQNAKSKSSS